MKIGSVRTTLAAAMLMTLLAAGGRDACARVVPSLDLRRATAVLNAHLRSERGGSYRYRTCAGIGATRYWKNLRRNPFEDTRFAFNPAGFRVVLEPNAVNLPYDAQARLRLLAKAGLLAQTRLPDGATRFTMTWKGFEASDLSGCLDTTEGPISAKILSWSGRRENGIVLYDVAARVSRGRPVAWAKSRAFAKAFGSSAAAELKGQTTVFELALGRHGYVVTLDHGRPVSDTRLNQALHEIYIRRAGLVDAASIARELRSELDGRLSRQASLCLPLPSRTEVDETDFYSHIRGSWDPPHKTSAYFIFYNLPQAPRRDRARILRGYAKMLKLQALGLAKSVGLAETRFVTSPAAGAVRFTVEDAKLQGLVEHPGRCFMVGKLAVDKVLRFEPLEPWRSKSRISARLKVVPVGPMGARAIALYGNFRRMAEAGVGVRFTMQPTAQGLYFAGSISQLPYEPDTSKVSLPVVVDKH